jgi:hypothetical protein
MKELTVIKEELTAALDRADTLIDLIANDDWDFTESLRLRTELETLKKNVSPTKVALVYYDDAILAAEEAEAEEEAE